MVVDKLSVVFKPGREDRETILDCLEAYAGAMKAFEEHRKNKPPAVIKECIGLICLKAAVQR